MQSEQVKEFLISRGYKYEAPHAGQSETTVADYYRTACEVKGIPHCLTNDKPPQIAVTEFFYAIREGAQWHSFEVGIRNEAPQGWIEFKFYSIREDELIARFDGPTNLIAST